MKKVEQMGRQTARSMAATTALKTARTKAGNWVDWMVGSRAGLRDNRWALLKEKRTGLTRAASWVGSMAGWRADWMGRLMVETMAAKTAAQRAGWTAGPTVGSTAASTAEPRVGWRAGSTAAKTAA